MKLGLLADIHCDVVGLRRALELFAAHAVEKIVCAGDLVEKGRGCDGDEVVRLLMEMGIPCVQGNHDSDAIGNQRWLRENLDPKHPVTSQYLLAEHTLEVLGTLPQTLDYELAGRRITIAHGVPSSRYTYLYACSPRIAYEQVMAETRAEIIVLGHTHRPMNVRFGGLQVVNPGAVCGEQVGGSSTCGILTVPDGRFEVFDLEHCVPVPLAMTVLDV